jgi:hypothetical protein
MQSALVGVEGGDVPIKHRSIAVLVAAIGPMRKKISELKQARGL